MWKFWSVINCILLHWRKNLTLERNSFLIFVGSGEHSYFIQIVQSCQDFQKFNAADQNSGWAFTHCKFLVFHNLVYTLAVAILYVHRRDQHVLTLIAMSFLFVLLIKRAFLFTFISGPELCTVTFLCRFYVIYWKVA